MLIITTFAPTNLPINVDNLKEKTAHSIFWSAINNGAIQLLNILIGIFLARLLPRADYGIVGVLAIFTLLAGNIQSSGFTQGLINLKNPSDRDYNSVFWFNIIASFILYGILFFSAPLIADFFRQPCLVDLSRFVFLGFVIAAFGITPNGYMVKNMMNREIAIVNLVAMVISGCVGVYLAFRQMAYWSLAWQQIIYIFVLNIGRFYYVNWRPSFHIDFEPVRQMFSFSVKILLTSIVTTLSGNILTFIFGRIFPIKTVGDYSQANKWSVMASSFVTGTLAQIAQTVLVQAVDEKEREKRIFRKMTRFTAFLAFPALLGLALISHELIITTITDKWEQAVPIMQILCIGAAFVPFYTLFQNLAISNKRSDIYMWCTVSQIAAQVALVILLRSEGIIPIIISYSAINVLWVLVWLIATGRLISLRLKCFLADIIPYLLITVLTLAITWAMTFWIQLPILLLLSRIVIATGLYCLFMTLFKIEIFRESMQFFRGKFHFRK